MKKRRTKHSCLIVDEGQLHMEMPVTAAEMYAVDCVVKTMRSKGIRENSPYWIAVVERTKDILMNHKEEVRRMYLDSKNILKQYIIRETGAEEYAAFSKMMRMGLTGDVMHDMKILEEVSRR